ncbi:RHS repeat-associated core domain-containing protein [Pseudomonas sp. 2FE]|uniref:RHS repeat-associated core domain-containing protein n=1 Tax=Pseudomonas sp. 2FE TaxID=2502190 RepID=UPI0010F482D0|nr:RHS repeat-associated core domain-containing protein [Pseudomonas sp. 2FE]
MSMKLTRTLLVVALASAAGLPLQAAERSWSYSYNSLGLIESADGPRTDVADITRYAYDAQGNLTQVTNALGHITQLSNYDADGHPQSITDANGVSTSLTYAPQGWLASISTAGSTTSFEHDAVGQITRVTRGDGSWLAYTWDHARRLTRIANNLGETVEYSLDAMGNRTAQRIKDSSSSLTQQQQWAYDELGRLLRSVGAAGQTSRVQYDLNDNPTALTNPKQNSHVRAYDALDRLVASSDPLNGVTALAYDAQDHLTQVSDPRGVTTRYVYDGLGNLTQLISPDSGTTSYAHDAAGNVISKTDARGVVTLYKYDALNRLTARTYPAKPALNVTYAYDMTTGGNYGIGRLTALKDSGGLIGYSYDARGNLTQQVRSLTVATLPKDESLKYAYDAANQLTGIGYPGGFSVTYPRNSAGQVTGVNLVMGTQPATSLASNLRYLPFGPLKSLTWGNGIQLVRQYDKDYQLAQQDIGSWQSKYSFDANGNIRSHSHSLFGNLNYGYDALDRLTEEKAAAQRKVYSYDASGNRKSRISYSATAGVETPLATQTLTTATTSNRLLKSGSVVVQLDAAGNSLTQFAGRTYVYNVQGRLQQVLNPTALYVDYSYNALGQRTLKRVYSGATISYTTSYLYGADGQLLGQVQYGATGIKTLAQYWIWLDGLPLAGIELKYASNGTTVASTTKYYLHSDHLNTPRLATDQSQKLLWSWNSDAFGVGKPNQDVDGNGIQTDIPLRFPGQQYDGHSGLNYNYFRDYDPETGRYVESDPIGLEGGLNTFEYVRGNPISRMDLYGLFDGAGAFFPVPGAPTTQEGAKAAVNYGKGAVYATGDFGSNYIDMRKANTIGADKYFHCKANCEAGQRGWGGSDMACLISNTREWTDQNIKGDPASASTADQIANNHGRTWGQYNPSQSCSQLCSAFRPSGLDQRY